ncbi:hypothetical protein ACFQY5_41565 [Paeniroseomonas aquatica]|uniref:hypothetical protein n=1 Tax=Paeniroseomonas aquatica TaxID=373043 RepID=UPI00360FA830
MAIYLTADKIVDCEGPAHWVMVTGSSIGLESIATLLKDLRTRLDGSRKHEWTLDRSTYTMQQVAERVREFLFDEKSAASGHQTWMQLRLCGYSAGRPLPEVWEVFLREKECDAAKLAQPEDGFGVNWNGEYEALNRIVLGLGQGFGVAALELGLPKNDLPDIERALMRSLYEDLALPAMPIQDAIDLARYLVETTAGFIRFSVRKQPKTVGGPREIAAITKHEGFCWVQRRHFHHIAESGSTAAVAR